MADKVPAFVALAGCALLFLVRDVFRSNGDLLEIKGGPVSKLPPACEPMFFLICISLNL